MTRSEILDGLKEVFATVKPKMDLSRVSEDSSLTLDLGLDSLSMLLMALAVEQKFGFDFKMGRPFKTVGDVVGYVAENVA